MDSRSQEKELLDLGNEHYSKEEYNDCLVKLDYIGKWLGGDAATFKALRRLKTPPESILDVGCGGGLFAVKLGKKYPQARVCGIDVNPWAIEFANKRSMPNVIFEWRKEEKLHEPAKSYDVVLATLVCHHLTDEQLVEFIIQACRIGKKKVVINDLHRHPLAWGIFKLISPFYQNRLIQHDGLISIKRGFVFQDWKKILAQANISSSSYQIKWQWAFRWMVEITP